MNKMLTNKTCIIVGASGEIGLNCSQLFYDQGARLILIYNKNFKVIKQFNKNKKNIYAFKCDLSKEMEVKNVFKKIIKKFPEINVLVNAAGVMDIQNFFIDDNLKNLKNHFNINIHSAILITKLISRNMIRSENPSIINISSVAANHGILSLSNYSSSKGALKSFTISSARELGPLGVRVNCISPGIIKTKLHKNNKLEKFKKNITLERLGKPREVANVALFLASQYSSYINGQDLKVDGQLKVF
jgi:3-oxoacyl-[acyl-carrier protein] reductase